MKAFSRACFGISMFCYSSTKKFCLAIRFTQNEMMVTPARRWLPNLIKSLGSPARSTLCSVQHPAQLSALQLPPPAAATHTLRFMLRTHHYYSVAGTPGSENAKTKVLNLSNDCLFEQHSCRYCCSL